TMVAEAFRPKNEKVPIGGLGLIGLVGAGLASFFLWDRDTSSFGVVRADNFALFINFVLVVVGVLTIFFSGDVIEREELPAGEYYALMLFSIAGMMLMAAAIDLLMIFLALEILSLGVYTLTAIRRSSPLSAEGGFKYFLLGAFSSAFFLYGVAMAYTVAHSTRLDALALAVGAQASEPGILLTMAVGLIMVGFAFKVSAVPFHMWTPDAYQGAPTVVTGFMSTAVKAAAFAGFVRVFLSAFDPLRESWIPILGAVAIATMIVGTVVGVAQTSVKRMLAYSSIAHAGYILVGIIAGGTVGKSAVLFYIVAYAITNLGAFAILALLGSKSHEHDEVRDFAGLWHSRPALAGLMAVFLLSLGGFPPTAGFIGKWYIFEAAVQEGYYALAIVGVLTSVISVFYYLRIIVMMYMSEAPHEAPALPLSPAATAGLAMSVLVVFYLGVYPTTVIDLALRSIETIF
ncbi:MAG TPA: NADH-quinone oxidoreductase subunit N, partial [Vicinamibacterales bacterium]